jgi:hypothetical protein
VAVLSLSSRPYQKHDELSCDTEGDLVPVIFFHEGQGEVDACSDASRRIGRAITQINWIGANFDLWELTRETIAEVPMGHGAFSIQESSGRQDKGAGADGGNAPGSCRRGRDPGEVGLIVDSALCAGSPGNDEGVDRSGDLLKWDRTAKGDPAVGSKCTRSVWRRDLDTVPGSIGKDLEWPGHIKNLHRRRASDHNSAHTAILGRRGAYGLKSPLLILDAMALEHRRASYCLKTAWTLQWVASVAADAGQKLLRSLAKGLRHRWKPVSEALERLYLTPWEKHRDMSGPHRGGNLFHQKDIF